MDEKRKIQVGDCIELYSLEQLLDGAKTPNAREYIETMLDREIELTNVESICLVKVSPRRFVIDSVMTEDNSICLDDGYIVLDSSYYDIARLNKAKYVWDDKINQGGWVL